MTEAEWLAATDPTTLLEFLRGKASDRKLRLFNCACCRRIWHLLSDYPGRSAVEIAERYLDGGSGPLELATAHDAAVDFITEFLRRFEEWTCDTDCLLSPKLNAVQVAAFAARERSEPFGIEEAYEGSHKYALTALATDLQTDSPERRWQTNSLRDIFGNPFRPVVVDPAWLTSTVRMLAEGIYEDRAFDRLPILADTLQDAGCDNEDVLTHCHSEGPHVRGCWVVDLLLGKE